MWIKGLTWLMEDTLQAATPLQIERYDPPLMLLGSGAWGPRTQTSDSTHSSPQVPP
jgi:hypothetical protein